MWSAKEQLMGHESESKLLAKQVNDRLM
jgi:hypothetical protein